MVHAVAKVCMKHIYKVIYELSSYLVTFEGQIKPTDLSRGCLINSASHDQSLYEIHIVSHMAFQFILYQLTFDDIERTNQGHWVCSGIYFINYARSGHNLLETPTGSSGHSLLETPMECHL